LARETGHNEDYLGSVERGTARGSPELLADLEAAIARARAGQPQFPTGRTLEIPEIRVFRKAAGLTIKSLAERTGWNPVYVNCVELGQANPSREFLAAATQVLGEAVGRPAASGASGAEPTNQEATASSPKPKKPKPQAPSGKPQSPSRSRYIGRTKPETPEPDELSVAERTLRLAHGFVDQFDFGLDCLEHGAQGSLYQTAAEAVQSSLRGMLCLRQRVSVLDPDDPLHGSDAVKYIQTRIGAGLDGWCLRIAALPKAPQGLYEAAENWLEPRLRAGRKRIDELRQGLKTVVV